MLGLATAGFAVNFWAWAMLSPLGPRFKDVLYLTGSQQALIVAVPVIVGSLGRIPVGALTDRYGGRVMFPLVSLVSLVTIVPVVFIGLAGQSSMTSLLVGGFFLGVGGTAFAVGVPLVNSWFPPQRRGLTIGVFGAGMSGTAISALTNVNLVTGVGQPARFLITAAVLAVYAVVAALFLRDVPGRVVPTTSLVSRLGAAARLPITWQACLLYAVAFGGYVAFSTSRAYLKTAYGLDQADASNRMAGFVVLAVIMRPVGGWLSDRIGPIPVLHRRVRRRHRRCRDPGRHPRFRAAGHHRVPRHGRRPRSGQRRYLRARRPGRARRAGRVGGLVGAAGGLGGVVPPLVMGAVYSATGSYGIGLALLAVVPPPACSSR